MSIATTSGQPPPTTVPTPPPATPPPPPSRSTWRRIREQPDLRRLVACVLAMAVLAVMTGPEGRSTYALSGFTGSLFHPRVAIFAVLAAALWLLMTFYQRVRTEVRAASDWVGALPGRLMPNLLVRIPVYLAILAAAIVVPLTLNPFWQEVLVDQIGVYVLLALGLNVVVGFAGLLDLGYVAFYAIGAYSCAFWTGKLPVHPVHLNAFWAIPFAILAAMLAGVLLGLPTLRLRGDYLAIVTLGFGGIIEIVANNWYGLTNGAFGVLNIPHFSVHLLGIRYAWGGSELPYYYLLLAFVVIAVFAYSSLDNSRIGRAWAAIREDEVAASATGINVLKYKVMAFAIGAATSGFAGMITASKIGYISPGSFVVQISILVLVLVIFGGMGSIVGAIVGSAFLQWFPWYLRVHPLFGFQQEDVFIYLGALLIVMMIFRPQGLVPSRRRRREIGLAEHGIGSADALDEAAPGAR